MLQNFELGSFSSWKKNEFADKLQQIINKHGIGVKISSIDEYGMDPTTHLPYFEVEFEGNVLELMKLYAKSCGYNDFDVNHLTPKQVKSFGYSVF